MISDLYTIYVFVTRYVISSLQSIAVKGYLIVIILSPSMSTFMTRMQMLIVTHSVVNMRYMLYKRCDGERNMTQSWIHMCLMMGRCMKMCGTDACLSFRFHNKQKTSLQVSYKQDVGKVQMVTKKNKHCLSTTPPPLLRPSWQIYSFHKVQVKIKHTYLTPQYWVPSQLVHYRMPGYVCRQTEIAFFFNGISIHKNTVMTSRFYPNFVKKKHNWD